MIDTEMNCENCDWKVWLVSLTHFRCNMSKRVFLQNQKHEDIGLGWGQVIDPEKLTCFTRRKVKMLGKQNQQIFTAVMI